MKNDKHPAHPCVGCVYFKECENTNRSMPCEGRMTKSERKKNDSRT